MRCGRCRAEVMLGSAQCQKCGASVLDGRVPVTAVAPVEAPPDQPAPPTRPPRPPRQQRQQRQQPLPGQQPKKKPGCGCFLVALLFGAAPVIGGVASGIRSVVDDIRGPETVDMGTLDLDSPRHATLDEDERHRWTIRGVGAPVRITASGQGGTDPEIEVRERDGDVIGEDDDGGPSLDSLLVLELRQSTVYEIVVADVQDDGGPYVLTAARVPLVEAGPLTEGQPVAGAIEEGGRARYTFAGDGRDVVITVRGQFDSTLTVYDADGRQLAFNDDTVGTDPQVQVPVGPGETITIEVAGYSDRFGEYIIELR